MADGWDKRPGVRVLFGRWEDIVRDTPDLGTFDGIFFDTFDDDFLAFHDVVPALLSPGGVYSFFNGIYPENVFFQGVACQMIQNHLETFGLETKFIECDVDCGDDKTWEGVQFRYFQGLSLGIWVFISFGTKPFASFLITWSFFMPREAFLYYAQWCSW